MDHRYKQCGRLTPHNPHSHHWGDEYDDYWSECKGVFGVEGVVACPSEVQHPLHFWMDKEKVYHECKGLKQDTWVWGVRHDANAEPVFSVSEQAARTIHATCFAHHQCELVRKLNTVIERVE